MEDNELFPADLLCLHSALPDRVCFIKTTNLDGESNLKIRRPLDLKDEVIGFLYWELYSGHVILQFCHRASRRAL